MLGPSFTPGQTYLEIIEHWENGRPESAPITSEQIPPDHPHRDALLGIQELYRVVGEELARFPTSPTE